MWHFRVVNNSTRLGYFQLCHNSVKSFVVVVLVLVAVVHVAVVFVAVVFVVGSET